MSDFTQQIHAGTSITEIIKKAWINDEIIQPQHIICGILQQKNLLIKSGKLKKYIERFLNENRIVTSYSVKQIISNGLKFLIRNEIIQKKDDYLVGLKTDIILKYSELIKKTNS